MDEIDRALAELAAKGGPAAVAEEEARQRAVKLQLDPTWQAVKETFSFDPKFLDADAELRKFFGSKIVRSRRLVLVWTAC